MNWSENNMMNILKKRIKWCKRLLKSSFIESWYIYCQKTYPLNSRAILLQSRYGDDLGGNIFYILKELSERYPEYTLYLAYKKEKEDLYRTLLKNYSINDIILVELHKAKYWYLLATCKYLINDVTFHTAFIKRKGQIYLNTWHGIPLKKMGLEEEKTGYLFGNMQRNFLASDYLLFPNEYMKDIMFRAYSLKNLYRGLILDEGYPRNSIFFDREREKYLKNKLGLINKQIIVYMPTWRGNTESKKIDNYIIKLTSHLDKIDEKLNDHQILYIKLHPLVKKVLNINKYKNIKQFPNGYETYDILNVADCLITDYSSVMFDFACSNKQIILFTYDIDEYLLDRGIYIDIEKLPFAHAKTVEELISAINDKAYDKNKFIYEIIKNDNKDAAKHICSIILSDKNKHSEVIAENRKENVYIFIDYLAKNGITSSVFNLLNTIDKSRRNYFCVFRSKGIKKYKDRLNDLPVGVGICSIDSIERTIPELLSLFLYYNININNKIIHYFIKEHYRRMFKKYYGNISDGIFLQFVGYGRDPLHIFLEGNKKVVWVHNDMRKEIEVRKVQHEATLIECYQNYDKVAGVSVASMEIAKSIAHNKGNFEVVHNCFDYIDVIEKSNKPITFDDDTECNLSNEIYLNDFLNSKGNNFITIGRFSMEKQHFKLLEAFEMYSKEKPYSKLIIIGGHGPLYEETLRYSRKLSCWKNICIVKSIKNPMPILKKCNLFILSSSNEGLPVVFLEADCLGIPILSTDIDGPHELLNEYKGGLLVEETAEAIYKGMLEYDKGNIKTLNIDMKLYNQKSLKEFEKLFE